MDNNIWNIKEAEKICSIDLDGVCNNYPKCWIEFINKELGKDFKTLDEVKNIIAYDVYKKLKEKYRLSGVKENLEVNPDAILLTQELKKLGWTIIIITARPAQKYPNLARQTYNWLDKNKIEYDYVLFGEKEKHVRVIEQFQQLKFLVDDNSFICGQCAKWGYRAFLLNGEQNKGLLVDKGVTRIDSLKEIIGYARENRW